MQQTDFVWVGSEVRETERLREQEGSVCNTLNPLGRIRSRLPSKSNAQKSSRQRVDAVADSKGPSDVQSDTLGCVVDSFRGDLLQLETPLNTSPKPYCLSAEHCCIQAWREIDVRPFSSYTNLGSAVCFPRLNL